MHEDYKSQRPHGVPSTPVTARIPEEWKGQLEVIALTEGDNLNGILQEGVMRVIAARVSDPSYPARMANALEARTKIEEAHRTALERAILDIS